MLKFIRSIFPKKEEQKEKVSVVETPFETASRQLKMRDGSIKWDDKQIFFTDLRQHIRDLLIKTPDAIQIVDVKTLQNGTMFFDSLPSESKLEIFDSGYSSGMMKDFVYGGGLSSSVQLQWYSFQTFIGWQACALLAQHWFISKACSMPPRDAIRGGWSIKIPNEYGEGFNKIEDRLGKITKRMKIEHHCREMVRGMRIFGIRIVMPIVEYDQPDALEKPFNADNVKEGSYKGLSQIDPYWIIPVLDKNDTIPGKMNFYKPTWWVINGKRVHRSHLIICLGSEVPDILKPSYFFGGIPLTQLLYERVYSAELTANEAPKLAQSKRTQVLNTDTNAIAKDYDYASQALNDMARIQNNFGMKVIGEKDIFNQFDTNLSDMDDLTMTMYQIACSIAEVPLTKMMSQKPSGLSATGEFEIQTYHEMLSTIRTVDMQPLVERHYLLAWKSEIAPYLDGDNKFPDIEIQWNPLRVDTAKDKADVDSIKINTFKSAIEAGIIDAKVAADILRIDEQSMFHGMEEFIPYDAPQAVSDGWQGGLNGEQMKLVIKILIAHDDGKLDRNEARELLLQFGIDEKSINDMLQK